jgi:chemotaxis-related protein WspB
MLMIIFYIGTECYCCSCDSMIEIVPKIPLKQIPQMPNYLAGLLNYGGESIPIIDLSSILVGAPCQDYMHTRIMIFKNPVEGTIKTLGIVAEKVNEIREMDPNLFNESLHIKNLPFLMGIYNTTTESVQRVNIKQLFEKITQIQVK